MRVVVQKSKPSLEEAVNLFLQEEALLERRKLDSNNEKKGPNEALFSDTRAKFRGRGKFRGSGRSQNR